MKNKFQGSDVEDVFKSYPTIIRNKLLQIRQIIFDTAQSSPEVGEIEETLKWGEPSYITSQTKSGSTIRLGWKNSQMDQYAVYFNCKTTLVDTFKEIHANTFKYCGNRSILFAESDKIPLPELKHCIELALTYHLNKQRKKR